LSRGEAAAGGELRELGGSEVDEAFALEKFLFK